MPKVLTSDELPAAVEIFKAVALRWISAEARP